MRTRAQAGKTRVQDEKVRAQVLETRAQGEKVCAQGEKVRAQQSGTRAQGTNLCAQCFLCIAYTPNMLRSVVLMSLLIST